MPATGGPVHGHYAASNVGAPMYAFTRIQVHALLPSFFIEIVSSA
jgi:hypothetical protein